MNELPEDVDQWPKNPFALFGLDRNATERQARTAYVRAIKRFKPERYPIQFRVLREAYERLLTLVRSSDAVEAVLPSSDAGFEEEPHQFAEVRREFDLSHRLWEQAKEGQFEAAYRGICDLEAADPGRPDVCLKLYWLLEAAPSLDSERRPVFWLLAGMPRMDARRRLWKIFVRRIREDRSACTSLPTAQILPVLSDFARLLEYARTKWQGARNVLGENAAFHRVVIADVEWVERSVVSLSTSELLLLHLEAGEYLAWAREEPGQAFFEECRSRAAEAVVGDAETSSACDRFEDLALLASDWKLHLQIRSNWSRFVEAFPILWGASIDEIGSLVLRLWRPIVADLADSIDQLFTLRLLAPSVAEYIDDFVCEVESEWSIPSVEEGSESAIERFLDSIVDDPAVIRRSLIEFCTATWTPPQQVVAAALKNRRTHRESLRRLLEEAEDDDDLNTVWRIYALFWSILAPTEVLEPSRQTTTTFLNPA